jgi:hypothetical protein
MPSIQKAQALTRTVTAEREGKQRVRETPAGEIRPVSRQTEGRLLIHLPKDDLRWFRHHAVDVERSMSDIVRELLRDYRARETAASPARAR